MNFTQLRAFHAVASEGGFTRGARRLGLSQPALTMQVQALERTYGVALFRRHGHGVELTDFGRELWRHARRLFADLDDIEELMSSAGALRVGKLAIGADGPYAVMDLLAAFRARHPGIAIAVRVGNAARVLADLRDGRTDLAVLNLIEDAADLHHRGLDRDRIVAFAPVGHRRTTRTRITLAELAAAPLILREPGSATRALTTRAFEAAGLVPRIVLELGSREAVREAVLAGLGVATVFAKELVPAPGLETLEIEDAELSATISLACLPERRELRVVRAFLDVAAAASAVG